MAELLRTKKEAGQTLLEVVAAVSVGAIVSAAVTIAIITALANEQFSKNQNVATQYAQSAMEMVRRLRDTEVAVFSAYPEGKYCVADSAITFPEVLIGDCVPTIACTDNAGPVVDGRKTFIREVCIDHYTPLETGPCTPPTPLSGSSASLVTVKVSWTDGKCSGGANCHEVKLISCLSR